MSADTVKDNHVVEINYTLKDGEGQLIDSSDQAGGPMVYIHGHENILPKLESELAGKSVGDSFKLELKAEDAYGEYHDQMVQTIPKTEFPDVDKIQVGMQFQVQTESGEPIPVMVKEIQSESIVLDGNHPLAGLDLKFDVEVASIRVATEDEISHGHLHAHGESCGH
ncbi:peptidylprolyl isomerase [Halobacteriovorax marinus]|uniref:Peptidyl-prolyl cis-trans isomerase n=1 Tax=Halobacteriovorax marinus TaxID=97084 RepID=A0A1Y5FF70_9BACT|nr:peptidylprolyl isomerase [Halobacteriovorax marinus]